MRIRIFLMSLFAIFICHYVYAQDLRITSQHSEFSISEQGKVQKYILLKSDNDLVVKVKGPTYINIKFRGLVPIDKKGRITFTLSYLRDGGFRSTNTYDVKIEPKRQNKKIDVLSESPVWATEPLWIQIKVPDGDHIYQISRPIELSEGLILKVFKANKEDPTIAAKPEVADIPIAPLPPKEEKKKEEKRESKVLVAERVVEKGPVKEEKKMEEKVVEPESKRYFSTALKANLLVPTSKVNSTYALSLDLKYISPLLKNRLGFGVEVGYYPLSGKGKNIDPQAGLFDYSFDITNIPIFIGAEYSLPLKKIPFGVFINGGAAIVLSYSTSRVFGGEDYSDGVAYGYYLGGGAEVSPGYGFIISELRYSSAYLKYNTIVDYGETGNIGGTNIYIGYKLVF